LRQRGATPGHATIAINLASFLLALGLALSAVPFSPSTARAAPPEAEAASPRDDDPIESTNAKSDDRRSSSVSDNTRPVLKLSPQQWTISIPGSVRRRGLEAPVQLRQREDEVPAQEPPPEVEEGDGTPLHARAPEKKDNNKERDKEKETAARQQHGIRVWPMKADTYSFSQAFGCVPQIANFYFPGEGCPAEAPVVHSGIDMAAPEGTPFYAAAAGWVTDSGYDREVGVPNTRIIIQHVDRNDGYSTVYLHWVASYVEPGDFVEAGEMIGEVGNVGYSTGPHLHFEVVDLDSGENIDPVDWLPKKLGNEGYRGVPPKTRAHMRLPAGTTAGLPESADPAPPPPPERQKVPDTPGEDNGDDTLKRKLKRERKQERAAKRDARADERLDSSAEGSTDDAATAENADDTTKKGKNKERTRKRERNKDGDKSERAADGSDGDQEDTGDNTDDSRRKARHDNRDGRLGNSNGSGNGHDNKNNDQRGHEKKNDENGGKNGNGDKGNRDSGGGKNNGGKKESDTNASDDVATEGDENQTDDDTDQSADNGGDEDAADGQNLDDADTGATGDSAE
jgi:murein DD-endopeptidase MepM/ murein hydrolase activator NlpD